MTTVNESKRCSLITICAGRERHLANLLRGLARSTISPNEVIIVSPDPLAHLAEIVDVPVRFVKIGLAANENFHLATARNMGAAAARYDYLVFLDVDCIPAPTFLHNLLQHPAADQALVMGEPYYLAEPLPSAWDVALLSAQSTPHPIRPVPPPGGTREEEYGMFWSLCFLVHRVVFNQVGGFDETFSGYGAEDTDFAFTARRLGIPLYLVPAVVYHQQHVVYSPPVNHFDSIVANSRCFFRKWNHWPMAGWLSEFADFGLIRWSAGAADITVVKQPDTTLLNHCKRPTAPYA